MRQSLTPSCGSCTAVRELASPGFSSSPKTWVGGWELGLSYQIVALHAVMAQLLEGGSIHHALGINPFGRKKDAQGAQKASQRQADVAQRVMQWRWLFHRRD